MTLDPRDLRYRFEPDYVCAQCGLRFKYGEHDFAACVGTRGTDDGIYGVDMIGRQ